VSASELFFAFAQLLGGIGLFMYGMELMSGELQKTAGNKLRMILSRVTTNRWSGLGIGTFMGFLIHSGPATVMMVGFTNAGLMDLTQSVSVVFGANVGTSLSMQVISFNVDRYCFLAIFVGLISRLLGRRAVIRHSGLVLAGLGLLFLGIRLMSEAVVPLKETGYFEAMLRHFDASSLTGMFSALLSSVLFTALIQSSGATIGILFALSTAGVFTSIHQVFPLILGAHIGTCAPALIGSIGASISARRAALAHLTFNILGAAIALILYRVYVSLIPLTSASMVRQIANTHTIVQALTALIFIPFTRQYADFITKIFPSHEVEPEKSHLDEDLLATPERAIVAALRELRRMAIITRKMLHEAMRGFLDIAPKRFLAVEKSEQALDALKDAVNSYLTALAERELSLRQAIIIQHLEEATAAMERIGDHVDSIVELTEEKLEKDVWFPDDTILGLIELYKRADHMLLLSIKSFEPAAGDVASRRAAEILEVYHQYTACSLSIRQKERNKILAKKEGALSGIFSHRYIVCFNRIMHHSKTIALMEKEPLFFIKSRKLAKRSEKSPVPEKAKRVKTPYDSDIFNRD
jgi:phosphate:Na+ symporter